MDHILKTTTTTERVIPDKFVRLALKVHGGPLGQHPAMIEDTFREWREEL